MENGCNNGKHVIYNLNVHFIHFNNKGSKMYGVNHFRPCFLRFRPAFGHCFWLSLSVYCNSGITMVLIGYKNCSQGFFENSLNLPLQSSLFSASGLKARPFNFTPAGCQEHFGSFGVHSRPSSTRIFIKVNVCLKCMLKIETISKTILSLENPYTSIRHNFFTLS